MGIFKTTAQNERATTADQVRWTDACSWHLPRIDFDEKNKENYTLELKELEKNEEKIVFGVTIFSEGTRLPVNHYRSKVTLLNKKIIPSLPKFKHTISNSYEATEGQVLYEDGSLFHAPYFQGVNKILDCTKDQIVLSCIAKEVPLSEQGQFPVKRLNTFFADIQYQGLLIWVQKNYDGAKSLPLETECALLYKEIPFGKELFVSVKIKEATNSKLEAECTVYDDNGIVYLQTLGAIVTISKQLVW